MFCHEFKTPAGIFRYKNQSGIETNPITRDGEVIGWQAKFYDTKLSDNKPELIGMIAKSKRDYPDLTKIIFYTNQDWGQGKKENDSEIKKEVDQKAKASGIEIEWRTASFFESPLVTEENEKIAKHFFAPDKSIFDLLAEKQRHTENVLLEIQTDIDFNGKKIEIDRDGIKPGDRLFLDRRKFEGHTAWILKVPDKDEIKWFGSLRKYAKGKKHDIESIRKSIGKSRAAET